MANKASLRNIAWFSLAPIASAIISFLTIPATTWLVVPEEFAKSSMFIVMQALISAFLYLGMDHSYLREFNETRDQDHLLYRCLIPPFILAIVIISVLIIFSIFEIKIFSLDSTTLILLAIWVPFSIVERFVLLSYRMNGRAKEYALFNIFIKFFILVFTLLFLMFEKSYIMIIIGTVVGQVLVDFLLAANLLKKFKTMNKTKSNHENILIKKMLKFGFPLMVGSLAIWSINSIDRLVLEAFTSYENLGIYFAGAKVVAVLMLFHNVFTTMWVPTAFRWYKEGVSNEQFHLVNKILFFILSLVFIIILIFKKLVVFLLSSEYSEAVSVVPFLLFLPIMYSLSEATGLGISFSRKSKYNLYISIIIVFISLLLNLFLVPTYGILGASIATAITYSIYFWIRTFVSRMLWYKFSVKYFFVIYALLILTSLGNVLISGLYIYVFNILMLFFLLVSSRKLFVNLNILKNLVKKH